MSEMKIVRPRLEFERQYGQYKNWWVRDPRIAGNPLSIYLFLLSHDVDYPITQTEAWKALGLGQRAWATAKRVLLECGFLIEVRDRYPDGYIDSDGRQRGRQHRYRLFLQDPEPGVQVALEDALIEVERPYEEWLSALNSLSNGPSVLDAETPDQSGTAKRSAQNVPGTAKRSAGEKPQVTSALRNAVPNSPALRNAVPSIGRENQGWLVGSNTRNIQPTNQTVSAREFTGHSNGHESSDAVLDAELATLHPDLVITMGQIRREVNGRLDLATVDVVSAVRDTVLRAAGKNRRVENPARYVASVLVRQPENWPVGGAVESSRPFEAAAIGDSGSASARPRCVENVHWWGPEAWGEMNRSHCVDCGKPRRDVEPEYAATELGNGGGDL